MAHPSTLPIPDPLTLVLLDDSVASSRLTEEHLKDAQIANDLTVVRTPTELLATLDTDETVRDEAQITRPDVLLLDTRLSTGYADDYLDDLLTHHVVMSIPVVLLAATDREAEFICETTNHPFPVLTKPLNSDELLDLLRAEADVGLSVIKHAGD